MRGNIQKGITLPGEGNKSEGLVINLGGSSVCSDPYQFGNYGDIC